MRCPVKKNTLLHAYFKNHFCRRFQILKSAGLKQNQVFSWNVLFISDFFFYHNQTAVQSIVVSGVKRKKLKLRHNHKVQAFINHNSDNSTFNNLQTSKLFR